MSERKKGLCQGMVRGRQAIDHIEMVIPRRLDQGRLRAEPGPDRREDCTLADEGGALRGADPAGQIDPRQGRVQGRKWRPPSGFANARRAAGAMAS